MEADVLFKLKRRSARGTSVCACSRAFLLGTSPSIHDFKIQPFFSSLVFGLTFWLEGDIFTRMPLIRSKKPLDARCKCFSTIGRLELDFWKR